MSVAVGADIEALCSKCGEVWHVVVANVGEKIAKVQCKECSGYHKYRSGKPSASASAKAKTTTRKTKATGKVTTRLEKAQVEPDLSRPIRTYKASEGFAPGDRVQHPTFGLGIVDGSPGDGKIDVFFPSGRRVLAQAKPLSATPPKPRPFDHEAGGGSGGE